MFCPQCGSTQDDELKFCKSCGANLQALRQLMFSGKGDDQFDWNKTWVAKMMLSHDEIDKREGKTPEMKRRNEIKAGVITASVGLGLMILLFVLMSGIVASGVSDKAAAVLSRLWIVGIIPLFVGAALVFNGMIVSKIRGKNASESPDTSTAELVDNSPISFLPPADTNELIPTPFSITDKTTKHLKTPR